MGLEALDAVEAYWDIKKYSRIKENLEEAQKTLDSVIQNLNGIITNFNAEFSQPYKFDNNGRMMYGEFIEAFYGNSVDVIEKYMKDCVEKIQGKKDELSQCMQQLESVIQTKQKTCDEFCESVKKPLEYFLS